MSADPPRLQDYDFDLPADRIAQRPSERRTEARLLHWRVDGSFAHLRFSDVVSLLRPRDLLVLNDTRVFPARLFGSKVGGGARIELLLVRPVRDDVRWEAMVRPGRRLAPGALVDLDGGVRVRVEEAAGEGTRQVAFPPDLDVFEHCRRHGHVPLPPYIEREDDAGDRERYQTVYAREEGSVAAPTAGLHFDDALLGKVGEVGARIAWVTLHVGPGTFRPPSEDQLRRGRLHAERYEVPGATLEAAREARASGGRVIAVGTTACRSLESVAPDARGDHGGDTELLIAPGHRFRWVDALITNFHLPQSSLLMLVAALAPGRWREAYALALREGYRFFSYGDANFIEVGR